MKLSNCKILENFMSVLSEQFLKSKIGSRVFTESQLCDLTDGTSARRYALLTSGYSG